MLTSQHRSHALQQHGLRAGRAAPLLVIGALVAGCATAPPAEKPVVPTSTGAAGGGTSVGGDASLQTCPDTVGTVRLQDGNASGATSAGTGGPSGNAGIDGLRALLRDAASLQQRGADNRASGGISVDSLRLLIQQSNCLAIVERGLGESAANDEKARTRSTANEVRDDANMGQGQEVAADFVLRSMVVAINMDESSSSAKGGLLGGLIGGLSGSKSESSADVQLVLFDVRTKVQLAVAQGRGTGSNTTLATAVLGGAAGLFGGVQASTSTKVTPGKLVLQAYADAYNKLVPALRNYKTQTVRGGLGTGGTLGVQGSKADPSAVKK